ncbi:MAG: alpha/beta fold hydrolase, partial [Kiloniellales bacterium]
MNIAYRTYGDAPLDLIYVPGLISHIEAFHEIPSYTEFIDALASFARVVTFDKRGQGLSDRVPGAPSVEERMLDIGAVMDAVGSERAALFGLSEGAPISVVFAATFPERTQALILFGG